MNRLLMLLCATVLMTGLPLGESQADDLDLLDLRAAVLSLIDQETAPFAAMSVGFGIGATAAHIGTPLRAHYAPQAGFILSGATVYSLISLATLGIVKGSILDDPVARRVARGLRAAAWTMGFASAVVSVSFGVFSLGVARWTDPAWSVAIFSVPLGMITSTVMLSVWAQRLDRVHRGENPRIGQRGRIKPQLAVGPGAFVVVW